MRPFFLLHLSPLRAWPCLATLALALACSPSGPGPLEAVLVPPDTAMPATGTEVVFQVAAQGGGAPSFQWLRNGQPIPGAASATLVLGPVALSDAGDYQAQVSDGSTLVVTAPFDLEPADVPWLVTSAADSGPGTLRDILAQANLLPGVNGIQFALPATGPHTIILQTPLPAVTGKVRILGPSDSPLTVDGGGVCRPLFLDGGTLVLDNFTLAHGLGKGGDGLGGGGGGAGMGGALFVNSGSLSLFRMAFQSNQAVGGSSFPGSDGENGGGGGFGGDSPAAGGAGADGGLLGGLGGPGQLDGTEYGGDASGGSGGAGGGAARGGPLTAPVAGWADNEFGGGGSFGGGGGFSVGPMGGGGLSEFGGGGGGSGGIVLGAVLAGGAGGEARWFGGDGGKGDGTSPARGGGGAGLGGAIFLRAGSLAMYQCSFTDNHAVAGSGDDTGTSLQALAQGKGGAVFIFAYDTVNKAPLYLDLLQAQSWSSNTAPDQMESSTYDNDDYYIAQEDFPAARRGSTLDLPWAR